jgi:hypothetical protein
MAALQAAHGQDSFPAIVSLPLKGLSYEKDFENVDENWQIWALIRAAAGFWIFRRPLWFLVEIKHTSSFW